MHSKSDLLNFDPICLFSDSIFVSSFLIWLLTLFWYAPVRMKTLARFAYYWSFPFDSWIFCLLQCFFFPVGFSFSTIFNIQWFLNGFIEILQGYNALFHFNVFLACQIIKFKSLYYKRSYTCIVEIVKLHKSIDIIWIKI